MSRSLCPLPWASLSFNTDTSLRVCCNTDHGGHVLNAEGGKALLQDIQDPQTARNLPTYKKLRSQMMKGQRPDFCRACYRVEDNGGHSVRQSYLRAFEARLPKMLAATTEDGTTDFPAVDLDLSLSNKCNLKCRMCNPGSTYALHVDFDKLGLPYDKTGARNADTLWRFEGLLQNIVEKEKLEQLLFTGGEPLTNPIHIQILEALVARGRASQIILRYHSNLMFLPDGLLKLWTQFKQIQLHASIEATGARNDYIRYKSDWNRLTENFRAVLDAPGVNMWCEVHSVFQAYSLFGIPDLLEYLKPLERKVAPMPHFIWLDQPEFLSVASLPPAMRRQGIQKVRKYLAANSHFYKDALYPEFTAEKISLLESHLLRAENLPDLTGLRREFTDYTRKLDSLRGQDLRLVAPEFEEMMP